MTSNSCGSTPSLRASAPERHREDAPRSLEASPIKGLSDPRSRRIGVTAMASLGAKVAGLLAMLVTVPLTVGYLGGERYGVWATIVSTAGLLGFADLGIANGAMNLVASSLGRDDRRSIAAHVTNALVALVALGALAVVGFALAIRFFPWTELLGVGTGAIADEAVITLAVFLGSVAAGLPAGLIPRVQFGLQEGHRNAGWTILGAGLAVVATLAVIHTGAGLPWLAAGVFGAPLGAAVANALCFFRRHPDLRPSFDHLRWDSIRQVLATGMLFFVLQAAAALGYETDTWIIASLLGPAAVSEYALTFRAVSVGPLVLGFALTALWPTYGEAIARGDLPWVRQALRRSLGLGLAINGPLAAALLLFGPLVFRLWVGDTVTPSRGLIASFAVWALLNAAGGPLATFLNGAGVLRFQVVCALAMAPANVLLSIVLVREQGPAGAVVGTIVAQLLFVLLPSALYLPRLLRTMKARTGQVEATTARPTR